MLFIFIRIRQKHWSFAGKHFQTQAGISADIRVECRWLICLRELFTICSKWLTSTASFSFCLVWFEMRFYYDMQQPRKSFRKIRWGLSFCNSLEWRTLRNYSYYTGSALRYSQFNNNFSHSFIRTNCQKLGLMCCKENHLKDYEQLFR